MSTIDEEMAVLREAMVAGVKRVRLRIDGVDKEVEYPSFEDLSDRLKWLEREKAAQAGQTPFRVGLASFSRGR